MDSTEIWIQLIITIGTAVTGMFAAFRYFISQSVKREKLMLEYFEQKNGHMERMREDFTKTINKNSTALLKMASKL